MGSISAFLQIAQLVLGLFPTIFSLVKVVEDAVPGHQQGKAKFDAVMGTVQGVYSAAGQALPAFEQAAPAIGAAVNSAVALMNATKSPAPTASPATP